MWFNSSDCRLQVHFFDKRRCKHIKKSYKKQHILEEIPEIEAKILKVSNRQKCKF